MLVPALLLAWALAQDPESVPPTSYDRVVALEIAAGDPWLEGYGPAVAYEYDVEFRGTLHIWTRSALDLVLRVENLDDRISFEDDDSGGGSVPYLSLQVEPGARYMVLVASKEGGGSLVLRLIACPEAEQTLEAARQALRTLLGAEDMQRAGEYETVRGLVGDLAQDLISLPSSRCSRPIAQVLHRLGALATSVGSLEQALVVEQHALAVFSSCLPESHGDVLMAKMNLGLTLQALGRLEDALALLQEVHSTYEALAPAGDPNLLLSELNLAVTMQELGDVEGSTRLLEHVHGVWAQSLPADDFDLLLVKQNLAFGRRRLGDPASALALEEAVHTAWSRLLPAHHENVLLAKLNLAATRRALGDLEGALVLNEQVYAARAELLPSDHPDLQQAKLSLALARESRGDLSGALELEEEVHALLEERLPPEHPRLLGIKANLASTRKHLGDLGGALELERSIHAILARDLRRDHPDVLGSKSNIAASLFLLGDLAGAADHYRDVHALLEQTHPPEHPDRIRVTRQLAILSWRLGDSQALCELLDELLGGLLQRAAALGMESPRFARSAAVQALGELSVALVLVGALADEERRHLEGQLFEVLETYRNVSTSSSEAALVAARDPTLREARERTAVVRRELNDLSQSPPDDPARVAEWRSDVLKLSDERDRLEREQQRLLTVRRSSAPGFELAGLAVSLPQDSVLVSYFDHPTSIADTDADEAQAPGRSLVAFTVTPAGRVCRVELGPTEPLRALASEWRECLGVGVFDVEDARARRGIGLESEASSAASERVVGKELAERVLGPCLRALEGTAFTRLYVIVDDFLNLVPLDALPWGEEGRLGEALDLSLDTSTARLLRGPRPVSGEGTLVAFGGVDYDARVDEARVDAIEVPNAAIPPVRRSPGFEEAARFAPLAGTRVEVGRLVELYRRDQREPVEIVGAAVTKTAVHRLSARARYLHIATHGWFAPETFESMIDSADNPRARDVFIRAGEAIRGFAPETLCGIALAGANLGVNALGEVPGIMTAEELATLDLSNCELAVLSACETNVGIRRAGQGIQSLQAALHAAGARTAITSLWKVDDSATRQLFERFYSYLWVERMGKADALWKAKMDIRDAGHPLRDWAGWVLTGDPE